MRSMAFVGAAELPMDLGIDFTAGSKRVIGNARWGWF